MISKWYDHCFVIKMNYHYRIRYNSHHCYCCQLDYHYNDYEFYFCIVFAVFVPLFYDAECMYLPRKFFFFYIFKNLSIKPGKFNYVFNKKCVRYLEVGRKIKAKTRSTSLILSEI